MAAREDVSVEIGAPDLVLTPPTGRGAVMSGDKAECPWLNVPGVVAGGKRADRGRDPARGGRGKAGRDTAGRGREPAGGGRDSTDLMMGVVRGRFLRFRLA